MPYLWLLWGRISARGEYVPNQSHSGLLCHGPVSPGRGGSARGRSPALQKDSGSPVRFRIRSARRWGRRMESWWLSFMLLKIHEIKCHARRFWPDGLSPIPVRRNTGMDPHSDTATSPPRASQSFQPPG